MKRIAFFMFSLMTLFLLSGCDNGAESKPTGAGVLRYDGIYCYIRDFDNDGLTNNYALRFYEDGTVIHASVEQQKKGSSYFPKASWFHRESEYYQDLLGEYQLTDGAITLTTHNPDGSVDYEGTVLTDKLMLSSHSNINGYEIKGCEYVFYAFDELSD